MSMVSETKSASVDDTVSSTVCWHPVNSSTKIVVTNTQNDKLTVIWNSYICGLLNGNNLSLSRTMEAINQAFVQSPYLKK